MGFSQQPKSRAEVGVTDHDFAKLLTLYFERLWTLSAPNEIKKYPKQVNWELLVELEEKYGMASE